MSANPESPNAKRSTAVEPWQQGRGAAGQGAGGGCFLLELVCATAGSFPVVGQQISPGLGCPALWSLPDLQGKCSHYGRFRATMCHKNWESAHTFSSRAYAPLGSSHQWATKPCTHPGATCLGVRTLPQTFQTSLCSLLRSLKNEVGGVSEVICAVLTGPRSPTSQMKKLRPRDVKDPSQPLHEHKGWKRTGGNAQGKPSRKISWGLPAPLHSPPF